MFESFFESLENNFFFIDSASNFLINPGFADQLLFNLGDQVQHPPLFMESIPPSKRTLTSYMNGDDYAGDTSTAGVVNVGGNTSGVIETAGDSDWFSLTLGGGETFEFSFDDQLMEAPSFALRDVSGNLVGNSASYSGGMEAVFAYTATTTAVLFVAVSDNSGEENVSYSFTSNKYVDDFGGDVSTLGALTTAQNIFGQLQGATDQDWFKVTVTAGEIIVVNGEGLDPSFHALNLYDSAGQVVTMGGFGPGGPNTITLNALISESGNYFIGISHIGEFPTDTAYELSMSSDDYAGDSSTTGAISNGETVQGSLEIEGDSDWFSIVLNAGETVEFNFGTNLLTVASLLLSDSSGGNYSFSTVSTGQNTFGRTTVSDSGTYYLRIAHNLGVETETPYSVEALVYEDDFSGDTSTQGVLTDEGSVSGVLEGAGDRDWFSISLNAGEQLTISTTGLTGSEQNIVLRDSAGDDLFAAFNGQNAELTFTAEMAGTYYLDLFNVVSLQNTAYTLFAQVALAPVILNLNGDIASFVTEQGPVRLDEAGGGRNYQGSTGLLAEISDVNDSGYDGGNFRASVTQNANSLEDILSFDTSLVTLAGTSAGSSLSVAGIVIGVLGADITEGSDLIVNLNGAATDSELSVLLRALTYDNSNTLSPSTLSRRVSVSVTDAEGDSSRMSDIRIDINIPSHAFFAGVERAADTSQSIDFGDVNGDGHLDAIFANSDAGNRVWINDGTGTLIDSGQVLRAGLGTADDSSDASLGDLDGDGDLDILEISFAGITAWRNDGTGQFRSYEIGISAGGRKSEFVDLNSDGLMDLVFSGDDGVWLNSGYGTFVSTSQSLAIDASQDIATGDIDGDGDQDLVFANNNEGNTVWLNDGQGTFTDTGQSLGSNFSRGVTLGDIDGDGDLDMGVANAGQQGAKIWVNDGFGNYTNTGQILRADGSNQSFDVQFGDMDGDDDLDLIVANHNGHSDRIYLNDGNGVFSFNGHAFGTGESNDIALGDLDGDGNLDIGIANAYRSPNTIWMNDGTSIVSPTYDLNTSSFDVALGDLDGDGDLDAVSANWAEFFGELSRGNTVSLNNGAGEFTHTGQFLGNYGTYSLVLGDVDGDGDLDIATANFSVGNRIWLNSGAGQFTDSGQSLGGSRSAGSAIGDVDGDGDLDLVFANRDQQDNVIWLNDGRGVYTQSAHNLGSGDNYNIELGDVDGDNDLDAFVDGVLWLNDGSGDYSETAQSLSSGVALADLDGDGDLDAVGAGSVNTWVNDGAGNFSAGQSSGLSSARDITTGDADGDGDIDIFAAIYINTRTFYNVVYLNDGTGQFSFSGQNIGTHRTEGLAVGDVNSDGRVDIVVSNWGQANTVFLNGTNSAPQFYNAALRYVVEDSTLAIALYVDDINAGDTLSLSISGGADASFFSLDTEIGHLVFNEAPDFESPSSDAQSNIYQVEVSAIDNHGAVTSRMFSISVLDRDGITLLGTSQDDQLVGTDDNDLFIGSEGADTLIGGDGFDTADYGAFGERIYVNLRDGIIAGTQTDTVSGIEAVIGTAFNDTLIGDDGSVVNRLNGGAGDDYLYGDVSDIFIGGAGYDTLIIEDLYAAGLEIDITGAGLERVFATNVADRIDASSETTNMVVYGFGGADIILTGSGDDYIYFDHEDITGGGIRANGGYDWLLNNSSSSFTGTITVDMGVMQVEGYYGGAGAEIIDASLQSSAVTIYANGGADQITGGAGGDVIYVTNETVSFAGGAGYDYIIYNSFDGSGLTVDLTATGFEGAVGRNGNDSFDASGNTVSASLYGAGGNDTLIGGSATDYFYGDAGNDTYTGNGGTDYFLHDLTFGNDTITDFAVGTDVMIVRTAGVASMANIVITQDGADALLTMGANSIRLTGVTAANLTAGDFLFAPTSAEAPEDGPETAAVSIKAKPDTTELVSETLDDFAVLDAPDASPVMTSSEDIALADLYVEFLVGHEAELLIIDVDGMSLL